MPRRRRFIYPGFPHHVTQRGVRKQDVFFRESDRTMYLNLLIDGCKKYKASILAYCLMKNHVHLIAIPKQKDSLHLLFKSVHSKYARIVNRRESWSGHLWQSRFFSSILDEDYFFNAVRYVELNPVRARLVEKVENYRWSSTRARAFGHTDPVLDLGNDWNTLLPAKAEWLEYLKLNEPEMEGVLREHSCRNLPCGGKGFIDRLEKEFNQCLIIRGRGRPKNVSVPFK